VRHDAAGNSDPLDDFVTRPLWTCFAILLASLLAMAWDRGLLQYARPGCGATCLHADTPLLPRGHDRCSTSSGASASWHYPHLHRFSMDRDILAHHTNYQAHPATQVQGHGDTEALPPTRHPAAVQDPSTTDQALAPASRAPRAPPCLELPRLRREP
jgi:hypothetical protein